MSIDYFTADTNLYSLIQLEVIYSHSSRLVHFRYSEGSSREGRGHRRACHYVLAAGAAVVDRPRRRDPPTRSVDLRDPAENQEPNPSVGERTPHVCHR